MSRNSEPTILDSGDPLGFLVRQGEAGSHSHLGQGNGVVKVEARMLARHQKEALVSDGEAGSVWRLTADEGAVMKGDDIAPFPLGYFNAGVMSDIAQRVRELLVARGIQWSRMGVEMVHTFGSTGSFLQSTARAYSEAAAFRIELEADLDADAGRELITAAWAASPAVALLQNPMSDNGFALYINGRRRKVVGHRNVDGRDVTDPFLAHTAMPRPAAGYVRTDLLTKLGAEGGELAMVPLASPDKRLFSIAAKGEISSDTREFKSETWIARPGMTHFSMVADVDNGQDAPSGLALLSAGISFCYLTQLHRYIEAQKLDVSGARLVQFSPYGTENSGRADPIDTHLFLTGSAPDETHERLLTMAARTCFMHVAAASKVQPKVELILNGVPLPNESGLLSAS